MDLGVSRWKYSCGEFRSIVYRHIRHDLVVRIKGKVDNSKIDRNNNSALARSLSSRNLGYALRTPRRGRQWWTPVSTAKSSTFEGHGSTGWIFLLGMSRTAEIPRKKWFFTSDPNVLIFKIGICMAACRNWTMFRRFGVDRTNIFIFRVSHPQYKISPTRDFMNKLGMFFWGGIGS